MRAFCEKAFAHLGIQLKWKGEGVNEKGIIDSIDEDLFHSATDQQLDSSILSPGKVLVEVDPQYFRPTEVDLVLGDAHKAKDKIGWEPKFSINELVEDMMKGDVQNLGS